MTQRVDHRPSNKLIEMPHLEDNQVMRISVDTYRAPADPARFAAPLSAAATYGGFNTNGWDTVYVIPLAEVNRAIKTAGSSPKSWKAELGPSKFAGKVEGEGHFDTWAVTTGGSGSLLHMKVPFDATLTGPDGTKTSVKGGIAHVQVKLDYLASDGQKKDLKVRTTGGGPDDPVVAVTSVSYASPPDGDEKAPLQGLLQKWFNANLDQFAHVFATVNLAQDEAQGAFSWLKPTYTSYAYIDAEKEEDALLGVLCMTEGRSARGAVQQVAAKSVIDGSPACFNISGERLLTKMMLPSLVAEFKDAPEGTFEVESDASRITANKPFNIEKVDVAGVSYQPVITNFTITMVGKTIETSMDIHTNISPGIDSYATITDYSTIKLATKKDNTQTLTFTRTQEPSKKSHVEVAAWVEIVEAVADLALFVIASVITKMVTSIERAVVRFIVILVVGAVTGAIAKVLEKIPEWIADEVPDAMPSIDPLIDAATSSVTWAHSKEFMIEKVQLSGALQLGGSPFANGSS